MRKGQSNHRRHTFGVSTSSHVFVNGSTVLGDTHHCSRIGGRIDLNQIEGSHMKETLSVTPGILKPGKGKNRPSPMVLGALKDIQTAKLCPEGLEIFLEGQVPTGIYILYAGRVKLSVTDNHGRQIILRTALPGDILGLSAVVSGKCYEETAVATIASQLGFIKCREFLRFLDRHTEAAFWVVQLLSERVTTTFEQLLCLQHASSSALRQ